MISFSNTENEFNDSVYLKIAEQIGLNIMDFRQTMNDKSLLKKFLKNKDYLSGLGIYTTPSFIINGKLLNDSYSINYLEDVIKTELPQHKRGTEPIEAVTTIPASVKIDSLAVLLNSASGANKGYNELTICFADPQNQRNYCVLSADGCLIKSNESCITSLPYYPPEYDVWAISLDALYFSDETFNGEQLSLTAYYNGPTFYGPQTISLCSISEGYFKYRTYYRRKVPQRTKRL